jgi:hypothetical protein
MVCISLKRIPLYYLHKNRKVLFYPDIIAITFFSGDNSFQTRFIDALNKFNPIVTLCPMIHPIPIKENIQGTFLQLLYENNYSVSCSQGVHYRC